MNDDNPRDLSETSNDLELEDLPTSVEVASSARDTPGAMATLIFFGSAEN